MKCLVLLTGAILVIFLTLLAVLGSRLGMMVRFPFALVLLLVTPVSDSGFWFLANNFANGVAFAFASGATFLLVLLAPFIVAALAFLAIAAFLVSVLIMLVVFL